MLFEPRFGFIKNSKIVLKFAGNGQAMILNTNIATKTIEGIRLSSRRDVANILRSRNIIVKEKSYKLETRIGLSKVQSN